MNEQYKPYLSRAKKCYELKELERLGLTPNLDQRDQILTYISMLLKWNDFAGLVSPKDEDNLFIRHFCDSLQPLLLFGFKKDASVLDIGAGGGFPSIPTKIFRPDLSFVLIEANKKKAAFLKEVSEELKFESVEILNKRTEKFEEENEKKFDYVVSRGVTSLIKFSQIAKPFINSDGRMYTFKTKQFEVELAEITNSKEQTGVGISEIAEYDLGNQISGLNLVSLMLL